MPGPFPYLSRASWALENGPIMHQNGDAGRGTDGPEDRELRGWRNEHSFPSVSL